MSVFNKKCLIPTRVLSTHMILFFFHLALLLTTQNYEGKPKCKIQRWDRLIIL